MASFSSGGPDIAPLQEEVRKVNQTVQEALSAAALWQPLVEQLRKIASLQTERTHAVLNDLGRSLAAVRMDFRALQAVPQLPVLNRPVVRTPLPRWVGLSATQAWQARIEQKLDRQGEQIENEAANASVTREHISRLNGQMDQLMNLPIDD